MSQEITPLRSSVGPIHKAANSGLAMPLKWLWPLHRSILKTDSFTRETTEKGVVSASFYSWRFVQFVGNPFWNVWPIVIANNRFIISILEGSLTKDFWFTLLALDRFRIT